MNEYRVWEKSHNKFSSKPAICSQPLPEDIGNFIFQKYTGFNDVNGKKIYEGDFVRDFGSENANDYSIYLITFKYKSPESNHARNMESFTAGGNILLGTLSDHLVPELAIIVVGNIFENPEINIQRKIFPKV